MQIIDGYGHILAERSKEIEHKVELFIKMMLIFLIIFTAQVLRLKEVYVPPYVRPVLELKS